jgi:hypothetical protein
VQQALGLNMPSAARLDSLELMTSVMTDAITDRISELGLPHTPENMRMVAAGLLIIAHSTFVEGTGGTTEKFFELAEFIVRSISENGSRDVVVDGSADASGTAAAHGGQGGQATCEKGEVGRKRR